MSDLSSLFPELPADLIRDFEQPDHPLYSGPLRSQTGEVANVTDDQVAAYLQRMGSLRNPFLQPVVSGQQPPPVPEFANNGRMAPMPGMASIEAPDYSALPPEVQQQLGQYQQPQQQPPAESQSIPPPPPTVPPAQLNIPPVGSPTDTPPAGQPPQQQQPPQQLPGTPPPPPALPDRTQGIEALAQLWESDPNLRNVIARYLTTGDQDVPAVGQRPQAQPQPPASPAGPQTHYPPPQPAPQPFPPQTPTFPQPNVPVTPPFDEYTDPAVRALWERNQAIESQLTEIRQSQAQREQRELQSTLQDYHTIAESVASQFANTYQLTPEQIQEVRQVAGRMGIATTYMQGTHPVTGQPVRPDVAEAMQLALRAAYYVAPATRALEAARDAQRRQAETQHRQKLGGVGGSSASVPRGVPVPTTPQGIKDAMLNDVREMLNGSYTGN